MEGIRIIAKGLKNQYSEQSQQISDIASSIV